MKPVFVCVATVLILGDIALSQATVDETLETAVLYLDTATWSDSNPGTAALKLKTISASVRIALQNNKSNIGTKVIINPGTYRESVIIDTNYSGQTSMQ